MLSTVQVIIVVAISSLLTFIYRNRAIIVRSNTVHLPASVTPIIGAFFDFMRNITRIYDWKYEHILDAVAAGKEIICFSRFAAPPLFEICSPRMVEYILKTNFDNFEKGAILQDVFMDVFGHGILMSDGESWRRQRKTASHMFSTNKLSDHMLEVFVRHANLVNDRLDRFSSTVIDVQDLTLRYTLDSIGAIAFGVDIASLAADEQPQFAKSFDIVQQIVIKRFIYPTFVWKFKKLLNIGEEAVLQKNIAIVNQFVRSVITTRRDNLDKFENSGDLLTLFLNDAKSRGEEMSDEMLRDVILTFLAAGRDTTAAGLTYMFMMLSSHPDIVDRVRDEVESIVGTDGVIDADAVKKMTLLECVFMETIRLHPPASSDVKTSIKSCTFPDGSTIPGGSRIAYSPYSFGKLESIWGADAADFNPDRWLDASTGRIIQPSMFAYPHFNAGPRTCLGKSMAIMEAKILAATVLRKYTLRVVPNHDATYNVSMILSLKYGLPCSIDKRT